MLNILKKKYFFFENNFKNVIKSYINYNFKMNIFQFSNISSSNIKELNLNQMNKHILKNSNTNNFNKTDSNDNSKNSGTNHNNNKDVSNNTKKTQNTVSNANKKKINWFLIWDKVTDWNEVFWILFLISYIPIACIAYLYFKFPWFFLVLIILLLPIFIILNIRLIRDYEFYERFCKWAANRSEVTKTETKKSWYDTTIGVVVNSVQKTLGVGSMKTEGSEVTKTGTKKSLYGTTIGVVFNRVQKTLGVGSMKTEGSENEEKQYEYVETEEERIKRENEIIYSENIYDKFLFKLGLSIVLFLIFLLILCIPNVICFFFGWLVAERSIMWGFLLKILYYGIISLYFLRAGTPFKSVSFIPLAVMLYTSGLYFFIGVSYWVLARYTSWLPKGFTEPTFYTIFEEHMLYQLSIFFFYVVYTRFLFHLARKKIPEFDNYYKCYTEVHYANIWEEKWFFLKYYPIQYYEQEPFTLWVHSFKDSLLRIAMVLSLYASVGGATGFLGNFLDNRHGYEVLFHCKMAIAFFGMLAFLLFIIDSRKVQFKDDLASGIAVILYLILAAIGWFGKVGLKNAPSIININFSIPLNIYIILIILPLLIAFIIKLNVLVPIRVRKQTFFNLSQDPDKELVLSSLVAALHMIIIIVITNLFFTYRSDTELLLTILFIMFVLCPGYFIIPEVYDRIFLFKVLQNILKPISYNNTDEQDPNFKIKYFWFDRLVWFATIAVSLLAIHYFFFAILSEVLNITTLKPRFKYSECIFLDFCYVWCGLMGAHILKRRLMLAVIPYLILRFLQIIYYAPYIPYDPTGEIVGMGDDAWPTWNLYFKVTYPVIFYILVAFYAKFIVSIGKTFDPEFRDFYDKYMESYYAKETLFKIKQPNIRKYWGIDSNYKEFVYMIFWIGMLIIFVTIALTIYSYYYYDFIHRGKMMPRAMELVHYRTYLTTWRMICTFWFFTIFTVLSYSTKISPRGLISTCALALILSLFIWQLYFPILTFKAYLYYISFPAAPTFLIQSIMWIKKRYF